MHAALSSTVVICTERYSSHRTSSPSSNFARTSERFCRFLSAKRCRASILHSRLMSAAPLHDSIRKNATRFCISDISASNGRRGLPEASAATSEECKAAANDKPFVYSKSVTCACASVCREKAVKRGIRMEACVERLCVFWTGAPWLTKVMKAMPVFGNKVRTTGEAWRRVGPWEEMAGGWRRERV